MHEVERATPDRVPALAALLGRAFVDDPMLVWPFGADRAELVTGFFRTFDEEIASRAWLWEAGVGEGSHRTAVPTSGSCGATRDRYFSGTPRLSANRLTSSVCSW
jgi:hypothetical protein